MGDAYHQPVMFRPVLEALVVDPDGVYLDATAGGGGHSAGMLSKLSSRGRVVAVDRDGEAIAKLGERFADEGRFTAVRGDFRDIGKLSGVLDAAPYSGVLFDFGVSSHQIDTAQRGFSFSLEGPLDMRMDDRGGLTAGDVVNRYDEARLVHLLRTYGEESRARKIARAILAARPVDTTGRLAKVVESAVPHNVRTKTLARVFQAIRIEVNGELTAIEEALPAALDLLAPGGRLVTLAYHSLEDRIVKTFIRAQSGEHETDPYLPFTAGESGPARLKAIVRKAVKPSDQEIEENPRARSARMRVAEKIG